MLFINIFVLFYDLHLHDILSHPLFLFTEIIKTRTFLGGRNLSKSIKIAVSVNYVASRFSLLIYCVVCVYQVCWLMTSCYTYVDIELHMFIYVNITFCYVQKLNILFSCLDYKLYNSSNWSNVSNFKWFLGNNDMFSLLLIGRAAQNDTNAFQKRLYLMNRA